MNIVLAPDSFKGSLDAQAVCAALEHGLKRALPFTTITHKPMADGGEGTLKAVAEALPKEAQARITLHQVAAADGRLIAAPLLEFNDAGKPAALVEVASVVGITDHTALQTPISERSSQGVGQLLTIAQNRGAITLYLALGGSSTNDAGAGLWLGLGGGLWDAKGKPLAASPKALAKLAKVTPPSGIPKLIALSDVNNPLLGTLGASRVFGPQKGLTADELPFMDEVFARLAAHVDPTGMMAHNPGGGAAGGLGFMLQVLGGEFRSGADAVAKLIDLEGAIDKADWVISGEGKSDTQTLLGKAPYCVATLAKAKQVPVTLMSGGIDLAALPALNEVFTGGCFSLCHRPMSLADAINEAEPQLSALAEQLARLKGGAR